MVIVKLIGGLGNQLFQYALGRTISVKNSIPLKLDISGFETYKLHAYSLQHFNIVEEIASPDDLARFDTSGKNKPDNFMARLGAKILPYSFRYLTIAERGFHFDPEVLRLRGNVYLNGYWQSEKYFKDIDGVIRREFTVKHKPDRLSETIAETISTSDSVALHVRRGDYVSNPKTNQFHGVCTLEYYQNAIRKLTRTVKAPHFFIFSDDPQWTQENLVTGYPETLVTHNDASKSYEDFRLMGLCKHFIIANSSFSWWGAWLGRHPDKMVFAPKAWFQLQQKEYDTRDLIPNSWRLI